MEMNHDLYSYKDQIYLLCPPMTVKCLSYIKNVHVNCPQD